MLPNKIIEMKWQLLCFNLQLYGILFDGQSTTRQKANNGKDIESVKKKKKKKKREFSPE